MTEAAARLAYVLYEIYRRYAEAKLFPAPPGLAAADQDVQKTISMLATMDDTILRDLVAEKGRKRG